jgi:hypothetical protein
VVLDVLEGKVVRFHTSGMEAMGTGYIKSMAWEVLARNDTPQAGNALCEMLQDPSMKWNMLLFRAIAELGPNARCALPELKRLFDDPLPPPTPTEGKNKFSQEEIRLYRRIYVAGCLGAFDEDGGRAIPVLMQGLQESKPWLRTAAAENVAHWGPKASDAITTLVVMLGAPPESWRTSTWLFDNANPAAKALASMGKVALPSLVEALGSEDRAIRLGAAQALGMMGAEAKDAMPVLVQTAHSDEQLATVLIGTLAANAPTAEYSVPLFIRFVKGPGQYTRLAAIAALERMGPAAAEAIPDLEAVAANQDENSTIRKSARSALRSIRE